MNETLRMWVEVSFNIVYLLVVWTLVVLMWQRRHTVAAGERRVSALVMWAFALLALGDTGHVGFRVLAYALGGLEQTISLGGFQVGLVGAGALATGVTVTLFYVILLEVWRVRFGQRYGAFAFVLLAAALVRLLLMTLPANEWSRVEPPQPWSTLRNLPLMVQGLGVAYLILRDAARAGDHTFRWVGYMILVSYACYVPVILFVQQAPLIGMLMIPKTVAYLGIAFVTYSSLYRRRRQGAAVAVR